ncbi:MAG: MurR/RpiR family transcriptional regulator [Azospirillaceae bacterium]|nr:MurR/RpiR family transcriptional regulator [Azospirillaceae bacterium]
MTTYDELRTEISAQYKTLSNRLQQIARFALDNPDVMALEVIAEISQRAGVQPSAMIRFAKAFGFSGFSEMQRIYRSRLVGQTPRYRERIHDLQQAADQSLKTPDGVLAHFVEASINDLQHLREEVSPEKLERMVRLLRAARTIHVVGQRRSFATATYLSYGIAQLGCPCHLLDNIGGMFDQQAQWLAKGDALIAITFPPYAPETLSVVDRAVSLGIPVIAITDSALSPLRPIAAVSFEVEEVSMKGFRSLSATMCLAVSMVVSLGQAMEAQAGRTRTRRRSAPDEASEAHGLPRRE